MNRQDMNTKNTKYLLFLLASDILVGCRANSECPLSQACVNGACADPCSCGSNAKCTVVRHHPVCYCERGYSGSPYVGCTQGIYYIVY